MPARTIKRSHGIEIVYESRRIVYARFKHGYPQGWHPIPPEHYGSVAELVAYKEKQKAGRQIVRRLLKAGQPFACPCCGQEVFPNGR